MRFIFLLLLLPTIALAQSVPPLPREFRGAWVSSVNNGIWPSKKGLSVEEQKKEMLAILDAAVAMNLNAIVFQVRPAADALYESKLEPWSVYLTGVQGQAPSPYYDPLAMWIEESHKRGLELHAWFNPYRARAGHAGPLAANHISKIHPEVVKEYGENLWMDPGEPSAAKQTLAVLMDIVRRYDVDAIHTDDYYYPYKVKDKNFPDDESYARYQKSGGKLSRPDWRRDNVNQLIDQIYKQTKKLKPWVKVGYSPFGIWQPGNPPGIKGLNQFETLYADPKLWLNNGWLDYISPQLYWKIEGEQSFPKLLDWWISQNTQKRHVWPGMSDGHDAKEVIAQLNVTRKTAAGGNLHWNIKTLMRKSELRDAIVKGPYAEPALVPASPWLSGKAVLRPQARTSRQGEQIAITITPAANDTSWLWAIQARYGDTWKLAILPAATRQTTLSAKNLSQLAITAIDRTGNASPAAIVTVR